MLVISGAINQSRDNIHAPLVTVVHNTPFVAREAFIEILARISCLVSASILVRMSFVFSDNKCVFVNRFLDIISEREENHFFPCHNLKRFFSVILPIWKALGTLG